MKDISIITVSVLTLISTSMGSHLLSLLTTGLLSEKAELISTVLRNSAIVLGCASIIYLSTTAILGLFRKPHTGVD